MKSISITHIKKIFKREVEFLIDGVSNVSNPYHFLCLSTLDSQEVKSRTVILRNVQESPLTLYFNADYRSPKVKQMLKHHSCSVLLYDQKRKMQLRADCQVMIHHHNSVSKEIWNNTPLQSRKCYMGELNPSDTLDNWNPNVPTKYLKKDPDKLSSESGYENFTAIQLIVQYLDVLELHHDGHVRFGVDSKGQFVFLAP